LRHARAIRLIVPPIPKAVPRITRPDSMVRRKVSQPCDGVLDDAGRYCSGVEPPPPDAP
jgi:hypothetical protein